MRNTPDGRSEEGSEGRGPPWVFRWSGTTARVSMCCTCRQLWRNSIGSIPAPPF